MNFFTFKNYREAIRATLLAKKSQHGKPFTFQNLAAACRIQKTYLSNVLSGDGQLNEDQVYLAAGFLGLSGKERRFLQLLHAYERSSVESRRAELAAEIAVLEEESLKTAAHLATSAVPFAASDMADYYLDPHMQLVHAFMHVPRYSQNLELTATHLNLSKRQLADLLTRLERLQILTFQNGRYTVVKERIHLPAGGQLYAAHRVLSRVKSTEQMMRCQPSDTYNFSVTISADESTRKALQNDFLGFIKTAQGKVADAPAEDVYQINFDLFKWSQV